MTRVAAVDIGTNSTRLLVADADASGGLAPVHREVRITRLGQGVDASGHLAAEAIARTTAALTDYAAVWRDLGADRVRITATSAARDAANAAELAAAVGDATGGVELEVLSGEEEAATAYAGAVGGLPAVEGHAVCVLDIGGGSTELIRGRGAPEAATSRQLGSVRLTERAFDGDPPSPAAVDAARAVVAEELDAAAAAVDPGAADVLVAVAGTATTVAALHAGLATYEEGRVHGRRIPVEALAGLADRLLALSAADIAALGPVQPGREDVIAAGALILHAVAERFGFAEVVISESDILDGVAMGLLAG